MMVRELRLVGLPPFLGDPFTILPPEGKSSLTKDWLQEGLYRLFLASGIVIRTAT